LVINLVEHNVRHSGDSHALFLSGSAVRTQTNESHKSTPKTISSLTSQRTRGYSSIASKARERDEEETNRRALKPRTQREKAEGRR
jgi:hypothetical protein